MGQPKQLLKWGSTTLLGHTIETAIELKVKEVVVVLGAHLDRIQKEVKDYPVKISHNKSWKNGLGSSIALGFNHLAYSPFEYDAVLIMLADQPLISTSYFQSMLDHYKRREEQIIATSYGRSNFGVPALFDKSYFKALTLLKDDRGAKKLIDDFAKKVTTLTQQPSMADIDTMDDYESLYAANHQ